MRLPQKSRILSRSISRSNIVQSQIMINKDTKIVILLGKKGGFEGDQGEYPLQEALEQLVFHGDQYLVRETILHNKPLRDVLREQGAEAVVAELKKYAPDDYDLNEAFKNFVKEYKRKKLADFDILYHPVDEPLTFFGHIKSFKSMYKSAELLLESPFEEFKTNEGAKAISFHVGAIIQESPGFIFDDYDIPGYAECTYVIRDKKIKESELQRIYDSQDVSGGFVISESRLHEKTKRKDLPMAYYDGQSGYMLVAVERTNE